VIGGSPIRRVLQAGSDGSRLLVDDPGPRRRSKARERLPASMGFSPTNWETSGAYSVPTARAGEGVHWGVPQPGEAWVRQAEHTPSTEKGPCISQAGDVCSCPPGPPGEPRAPHVSLQVNLPHTSFETATYSSSQRSAAHEPLTNDQGRSPDRGMSAWMASSTAAGPGHARPGREAGAPRGAAPASP